MVYGPDFAPFIGGYLQKGFGWTSSFYFLGAYALVMLLIEWFFSGEAFTDLKPFKRKHIAETYRTVLRAPDFSMGLVVLGLTYGMVMSFAMSAPFIVENHFGFSPVVTGYCALISGFGIMSGGILGRSLSTLPFLKNCFWGGYGNTCRPAHVRYGKIRFQYLCLCRLYLPATPVQRFSVHRIFYLLPYPFPRVRRVTNGLTSGASYLVTSVASYTVVSLLHITNSPVLP